MRPAKPEAQFDDANDELLPALRAALRPEPLPPALVSRIRAAWYGRSAPIRRLSLRPFHLLGTAAAAAVLIAVLLQTGRVDRASESVGAVALSSDETAAIVTAIGTIAWEGSAEYLLDVVDASLDDVERTLQRKANSATLLPWGRDDDWDLPAAIDEGTSRSRTYQRGLILAGCDRKGTGAWRIQV